MNEEHLEHACTFCLRVMQPSLTLSWDAQAERHAEFLCLQGCAIHGCAHPLHRSEREGEREKEGGRERERGREREKKRVRKREGDREKEGEM